MSVYVTGGGGTHLEPRVASHYLAAMVAEGGARGVLGTVVSIKTQQSEIDAPLDDLVIEACLADGTRTRLDLQITTTLSFTRSDEKWLDVVPRAWDTFRQTGFDPATRRIGIAVSQTTTKLERSIQPLLARARHAPDARQYRTRLAKENGANKEQREFQVVLDEIVKNHDVTATDDDVVSFMRCLDVIPFDLDKENASRDLLASIDQLTSVAGSNAEARRIWSSLAAMASRIIPNGGGTDRTSVVHELQTEGYTLGSDRAHTELIGALDADSRAAAASIRETIGGKSISRDELHETLLSALGEARVLRIVGQHGTGKSAMLKRLASEEPAGAPILLLRDLRVTGGGWAAHAAKFGRPMPIASLLRQFGLGGARTLFIDGADKMDAAAQVTINDLLKAIVDTPDLADWRVVMTMREENAQRVDAWLESDIASLPSKTIRVEGFDDDEANEAAAALPLLRPLLVDTRSYDAVLRRPFFLEALSRLPVRSGAEVRSEVDLVDLWWEHGGADRADFAPAQDRRNALLSLGEALLLGPGLALSIRGIEAVALHELLQAGVLRHVELGVSVAFSHDIFEEWILAKVLRGRRSEIAQALHDGGQHPQLARPLQLLAADLLERSETGNEWAALLEAVDDDELQTTWRRVVLTAPVRSVRSADMLDRIEAILMRDDARLLARLIMSVRTTETVRDLRFMDEKLFPDLTNDQREQYASETAGPEIVSWMRLIAWLIPRLGVMPASLDKELFTFLSTWASAIPGEFGRYAGLQETAAWAAEKLGDTDSTDERRRPALRGTPDYKDEARGLLLKCVSGAPDIVRNYLASISDHRVGRVRKQILELSVVLASVLPAEVTAFLKRAYLLDLDRPSERRRSGMIERSEALGFDDDHDFYPASPARPPFLHLLRTRTAIGLELISDLCNHAMEAWRQRQTGPGHTPIPITLDLGDGENEYWGDEGTYRWFRGGSHVHMLDTALLALDAWAHERLAAGDALDELCLRIARGNSCNAVLGIAAGLCLSDLRAAATSQAALEIGTHPALWQWDIGRQVGDMGSFSNEIAHWGKWAVLAGPLRDLNRLPHRKHTVRDLSVLFAGIASDEVKAAYSQRIATFLERVPYNTAEQRDDPDEANAARAAFEPLRQQADPANLVTEVVDDKTYISMRPPYVDDEKHQAFLEEQASLNRVLKLDLWAQKAIESGQPGDEFTLKAAFEEMIALDQSDLLEEVAPLVDMKRRYTQSGVAGTAAVLARDADELWPEVEEAVLHVIQRAATMVEQEDGLSYRGSKVHGHPPVMAAHAYVALVRRDPARHEWKAALLQLAVDPIEGVVEAVYKSASLLSDCTSDMLWRLFCLATQRAARTAAIGRSLHWSPAEAQEQSALADEAEQMMANGTIPSAHPAPLTAGTRRGDGYYRSDFHVNAMQIPVGPLMGSTTRGPMIDHAASLIDWALMSLDEKRNRGDTPYEWLFALYRWLGDLITYISPAELRALLIARVDAAESQAAAELVDGIMQRFMLNILIDKSPIDADTLEKWTVLIDWAIARPGWAFTPEDARQHDRGMAISAFLSFPHQGLISVIDDDWPNLPALLPSIQRAAETFATERTAFTAMLSMLERRSAQLLPQPGLAWIERVLQVRKSDGDFWHRNSNGELLVLLLRKLVQQQVVVGKNREIVIRAADLLIELGIKGAAHLQQDLVRVKR